MVMTENPKYDYPVDIWSLGIIFIEVMTGKRINELINSKLPCMV
jgi:hypothetical protein